MVLANMMLLSRTKMVDSLWNGIKTNHLMILSVFLVLLLPAIFCWSVDEILSDKMRSLRTNIVNSQISLYTRYLQAEIKSQWKPVSGLQDKSIFLVTVDSNGRVCAAIPSMNDTQNIDVQNNITQFISSLPALEPNHLGVSLMFETTLSNEPAEIQLAQKTINFQPYVARITKDVKARWTPPIENQAHDVSLVIRVYSDGTVANALVGHSSGIQAFDSSAIKALAQSTPLERFPEGSPKYVDMLLTFNSKGKPAAQKSKQANTKRKPGHHSGHDSGRPFIPYVPEGIS